MKILRFSLLFVLFLSVLPAANGYGFDPLGIKSASKELHSSVEVLSGTVNKLPDQLKNTIGTSVNLLTNDINKTINKLQNQTVPILNNAIKTDLNHLNDLVNSLSANLNNIIKNGITELDSTLEQRLNQLNVMIGDTLGRVDSMVKSWIELTKNSVIDIEEKGSVIVTRLLNKVVYYGIRYISIVLFLLGLLIVGVRLLGFIEKGVTWEQIKLNSLFIRVASVSLITIFLVTSLVLSIKPGSLAYLSGKIHMVSKKDSCKQYNTWKGYLAKAERFTGNHLIAATKKRLDNARKECLEN